MNDILLWLGVNFLLVASWSGSVAKGYLPFLNSWALYLMLIVTLAGLGAAVINYYLEITKENEND